MSRLRQVIAARARESLRGLKLNVAATRSRQVLLIAGLVGAITGLVVAGFDRLTADGLFAAVASAPLAVQVVIPCIGLVVGVFCLRLGGRGTNAATTDEYIRVFHSPLGQIDLRPVPARLLAAIATLGSGCPMGYEGPSIYAGAVVGSAIQRRATKFFGPQDRNVLMVAGAAAGVAAIFKAPVTGLVFALEVPYQEDLARNMLLPAAISAAASYVVFAAIAGTQPILPVAGAPAFNLVDLGGAAVVGLLAGYLARLFALAIRSAKHLVTGKRAPLRIALAGAVIGATVVLTHSLGSGHLALGPGYDALEWALDPRRGILAVVMLATLRVAGTAATVAGGGTGGLFIPLAIEGALVGRVVGGVFESHVSTLFPVLGMAAFLGAGYRVPLAAVVFVAEFTGRPGFVVPGLIAAVVAQLAMGRTSVSSYQTAGRVSHLERRLHLPLASVVEAEVLTAPPDATVEELFWQHLVGTRQQAVAVVDGDTYLGLACAEDLGTLSRETWPTTPVEAVMRRDVPTAAPTWEIRDAIHAMEAARVDRIAVCDGGKFCGVVTAVGLLQLDEVLEATEGPPAGRARSRRRRTGP